MGIIETSGKPKGFGIEQNEKDIVPYTYIYQKKIMKKCI